MRAAAASWMLVAGLITGCGGHVLPEIHSESDRLSVARRLYASGDYGSAIELLKAYTTSASGTADVDQAIYLLGLCHLGTREWALAAGEFERLLRDYPESDSSGSGAFRLGEAYFGQSRKEDYDQEYTIKALEQWQSYLRGHPGHWLNPEAERRVLGARTRLARKWLGTGTLYLRLRLFEPARFYFRRVIEEYPDTSARSEAELGLALVDARDRRRAEAVAQLKELEARYPGTPVAQRAARERKRLERD